MLAAHARLPLGRPFRPRTRNVRRPFTPSFNDGPYRLPRDAHERLTTALASFKNREAAYALAVFIARYHSAPGKIIDAFPLDRRALANHPELGLTEKRIRSAIRTLEEIGFLDRAVTSGSRYKPTEEGLRRKPIRFQFGSEYFPLFDAANKRAAAARERVSAAGRSQVLVNSHRASTGSAEAATFFHAGRRSRIKVAASDLDPLKGPKSTSEADRSMNLGPLVKSGIPPEAFEENPGLGTALENLLQGIRQSRGG
jgi:hypothetical protein